MKNPLLMKAGALALLLLFLMVPLGMVRSTIAERATFQQEARADIARSWGGEQRVIGPLLLQTYEMPVETSAWDEHREEYVEKIEWETRQQVVFPETLDIDGDVDVEQRSRGIYAVPVYRTDLQVHSTLAVPSAPDAARNLRNEVLVAVSDTRGFRQQPVMTWNGERLNMLAGTDTALKGGVHAQLPVDTGVFDLEVKLALAGSTRLAIAPVGGDTGMHLSSNWPHPGFGGGYLPESHDITAEGFEARWKTSHYATTVREAISACIAGASCGFQPTQLVELELTDPVNVYLLNERSVKYVLLFLVVIFGVFIVFEVLKRLRIHPVQYGMVGLGQAIFFLLLLSLSEHVAFASAYFVGAVACVALIGFYVSHVLGSLWRALGFATLLSGIYAALYVILQSEDYALLLGSLMLFGLLAIAMYLTRKVDWYGIEMPTLARDAT